MSTVSPEPSPGFPYFYDRHLGPVLIAGFAPRLAERVAAIAPRTLLETAAGTGIVTAALRQLLPGTAITATDLNAPVLDVARAKFAPGEIDFALADAQALPDPEAQCDAVVCSFGIMSYPDKPRATREALRVLRAGGRYFFSAWDSGRYNSFGRIGDAVMARLLPDDPPGYYVTPLSCAAIDPIKTELLDAGFSGIRAEVIHVDRPVTDLEGFVRGMIFGHPFVEKLRARGPDMPETVYRAVLEALRADFGSPPVAPLQAVFYSAIKPR